jgi:hypothetical protein
LTIIAVIAKSHKEFKSLVLQDAKFLGAGSTIFAEDKSKEALFRSSEDIGYNVKYLWIKSKKEALHREIVKTIESTVIKNEQTSYTKIALIAVGTILAILTYVVGF